MFRLKHSRKQAKDPNLQQLFSRELNFDCLDKKKLPIRPMPRPSFSLKYGMYSSGMARLHVHAGDFRAFSEFTKIRFFDQTMVLFNLHNARNLRYLEKLGLSFDPRRGIRVLFSEKEKYWQKQPVNVTSFGQTPPEQPPKQGIFSSVTIFRSFFRLTSPAHSTTQLSTFLTSHILTSANFSVEFSIF